MNQNQVEDQPEETKPELPEQAQLPSQPEPASVSEKEDKPKPGRFQRLFRRVLIWLVILTFIFMAGLLTDEYLRYKPLLETYKNTVSDLHQANQDISNLQAENKTLNSANQEANGEITSLEGDNKKLQGELDTANAHLKLLQVLVDVSNARLALFLNDLDGAKAALAGTSQQLEDLLPLIVEFDPNLAQSMPQRLNLIITGLDRDVETVKIDLELFSKDLLEVESTIFPK